MKRKKRTDPEWLAYRERSQATIRRVRELVAEAEARAARRAEAKQT